MEEQMKAIIEPEKDAPYYKHLLVSCKHVIARCAEIDKEVERIKSIETKSQKFKRLVNEALEKEVEKKKDKLDTRNLKGKQKKKMMDDFIKTRTIEIQRKVKETMDSDGCDYVENIEDIEIDDVAEKQHLLNLLHLAVYRFKVIKPTEDKETKTTLWKGKKHLFDIKNRFNCIDCRKKWCDYENDGCDSCIVFPDVKSFCTCSDDLFDLIYDDWCNEE